MRDTADQRKFQRLSRDNPVEVYPVFPSYEGQLAGSGRPFFIGRLRDLSEGGISFATATHLLAGSVLKFHFALNQTRMIEIFGTLVWSRENISGAKFLSITGLPQRTLRGYLAEK